MDFFEQQEQARAVSKRLIGMYALAVLGVVLSIHAVAAGLLHMAADDPSRDYPAFLLDPLIFVWTAGVAGFILVAGTLAKIYSLRTGGPGVAQSLGGREVAPDTRDFRERRLLNVVEEMALAAGVRVPHVFVLDQEEGFNAFAAGYAQDDATIAVTAGLLRTLNREELQAVIGHEFSHLLNGDMRLNLRLIGILGGIFSLAVVGRIVMEIAGRSMRVSSMRRSSKKDNSAALALGFLLLGVALWLIGSVGVLFGRLIQSAVSRQREYLADASAVQFTRNPDGLAAALMLIGASDQHGKLHHGRATEVSHMLFASGVKSLFATHPRLVTRIRRLVPSFDGDFQPARLQMRRRADARETVPDEEDLPNESILAWMSVEERSALREAESAEGCLYAAILSTDAAVREAQLRIVQARHASGAAFAEATERWGRRLAGRTSRQRRMACELAAETLRAADPALRSAIIQRLDALARADNTLDTFEFALGWLVRRRLAPEAVDVRKPVRAPASLVREASTVLRALASVGSPSPEDARTAWEAAVQRLELFGVPAAWDDTEESALPEMEETLEELSHLPPLAKREFLEACETLIRHDGCFTESEEDFLLAIADAIDAPGWRLSASLAEVPRETRPSEPSACA